jgi:hypothetical protein
MVGLLAIFLLFAASGCGQQEKSGPENTGVKLQQEQQNPEQAALLPGGTQGQQVVGKSGAAGEQARR